MSSLIPRFYNTQLCTLKRYATVLLQKYCLALCMQYLRLYGNHSAVAEGCFSSKKIREMQDVRLHECVPVSYSSTNLRCQVFQSLSCTGISLTQTIWLPILLWYVLLVKYQRIKFISLVYNAMQTYLLRIILSAATMDGSVDLDYCRCAIIVAFI